MGKRLVTTTVRFTLVDGTCFDKKFVSSRRMPGHVDWIWSELREAAIGGILAPNGNYYPGHRIAYMRTGVAYVS